MAKIVMRYAFYSDLRCRVRHAILAFEDAHYGCGRRLVDPRRSQFD